MNAILRFLMVLIISTLPSFVSAQVKVSNAEILKQASLSLSQKNFKKTEQLLENVYLNFLEEYNRPIEIQSFTEKKHIVQNYITDVKNVQRSDLANAAYLLSVICGLQLKVDEALKYAKQANSLEPKNILYLKNLETIESMRK